MRDNGLSGRIAFVTGAGGGIGRALVRLLVEEGARVVATDHDAALLAPIVEEFGAGVRTELLDIRSTEAVEAVVARIEAEEGPIDLGASVAGVLSWQTVVETSDDEWDRVFDINAKGAFRVGRALARRMQPRRRGALVTVTSNAAGVPRHAMAAYAASKAAAAMFTRCLGLELAPYGIRCNIVAPGSTLTPMQTGMWADGSGGSQVIAGAPEIFKAGIPLAKLATPEDVAEAVVFLLSARAGHITMSDLYVDGGATLRA